jgi:mono/diheme cytochrome c family protein
MIRVNGFILVAFLGLIPPCCLPLGAQKNTATPVEIPTFYRDVLPIVQEHCQVCHRSGGIAPMAFENYESTRGYAAAILGATQNRSMPPWFAEKGIGKFSNDPSLTDEEIALLAAWATARAPAGNPADAPTPKKWADRWTISTPDLEMKMAEPVNIPAG